MMERPITKNEIVDALYSVGLAKGHAVMVHTALSKIGYVCGGAQTVI
jgi:aminoglycoside 3-N-acetyltransferase